MLIITRREGESMVVVCGDRALEVQVVSMKGGQVRLGCRGDREMRVLRKELFNQPGAVSHFLERRSEQEPGREADNEDAEGAKLLEEAARQVDEVIKSNGLSISATKRSQLIGGVVTAAMEELAAEEAAAS